MPDQAVRGFEDVVEADAEADFGDDLYDSLERAKGWEGIGDGDDLPYWRTSR